MNNDFQNDLVNEVENHNKSDSYTSKRFKKIDVLIFALCLILAFVFWCYAQYVDDPIMKKNVTINFVLVGASDGEVLLKDSIRIPVRGERSVLSNKNSFTITVDRSEFSDYNKETVIQIDFPENVDSDYKEVVLVLTTN